MFLQFYEAEITGISANTVVVKFCAYGNHEEVLKSNCLPCPNQGKCWFKFVIIVGISLVQCKLICLKLKYANKKLNYNSTKTELLNWHKNIKFAFVRLLKFEDVINIYMYVHIHIFTITILVEYIFYIIG